MYKKKYMIGIWLTLIVNVCQAQTAEQADSLHQRGRELLNEGKVADGRECTRQAMEIREKLLGEVSEDYITSLNNYALSFGMEKDYMKAVELQEQVMVLCGKLKEPHKNIGMYTTNMGRFYYLIGDLAKAAKMWEQALPLVEKHGEIYDFLLNSLGSVYSDAGDKQALNRIMALMEEHNQHELMKPCDEPKCMLERAKYFSSTGQNTQAKEQFLKLLSMPMDEKMKVDAYYEYANFLHVNHDDFAAAENARIAAQTQQSISGKDESYAHLLNIAAIYSQGAKQYQQALECYQEVADFYARQDSPKVRKSLAQTQRYMGNCYAALEDLHQAKEYYKKALAYYEKEAQDDKDYPATIARIADMDRYMKDYEAAIPLYKQVLALFKEMGIFAEYQSMALSLQQCYSATGCLDEMVQFEQEAKDEEYAKLDEIINDEKAELEITRSYLVQQSYASSLGIIGSCFFRKEEIDSATIYFKQYIKEEREALRTEFRMKSATERMAMWENEKMHFSEIMQILMGTCANSDSQHRDDVSAMAYDAELISKGILLRSAIEFKKVLQAKGDMKLIELYNQTKTLDTKIDSLRQTASSDDDLKNITALTQQNKAMQLELYRKCAEVADFTDYLAYDWHDVQQAMNSNDVAIEFASIGDIGIREDCMVALVLTKDMNVPVPVLLWDNSKQEKWKNTEYFMTLQDSIRYRQMNDFMRKRDKDRILGNMIGKGIDEAFFNDLLVKTDSTETPYKTELKLYLQHLLTEYLRNDSISLFIGLRRYDRLVEENDFVFTSPVVSNLILGPLQPYLQGKKRIFFSADGILNSIAIEYLPHDGKPLSEQFEVYRLSSTKELCYKRKAVKTEKAVLFGDINYNDEATKSEHSQQLWASLRGSGDAGGFADLSNTRREVDEIQAVLKGSGVKDAERFRDSEASKEVFLGLSDSKVNILHIATHGVYNDVKKSTDAESMQNCLLAFAGANIDDRGIVTAADIATMNLRQCDLAVLSACETGLGKLSDDGVFGLQRGFKNAGVHTLLMSLKNVYDDSTADLMISFYKHLMNGASKREALIKAQQDIRNKGFTDPKYWATFILLDAL